MIRICPVVAMPLVSVARGCGRLYNPFLGTCWQEGETEYGIELLRALHPDWIKSDDGKWISRRFDFDRFTATMGFANAVAWVAESENHHPDLEVSYRYCVVKWTTHAIDGLSENDFICAAKVDRLMG